MDGRGWKGRAWVRTAVVVFALALLFALYVAAMHLTVDLSQVGERADAERRDLVYLYLHGAVLAAAIVAGWALGRWMAGLGFAFAVLFVLVMSMGMVGVQVGTHALACEGHNDIVRHWEC